MSFNPFGDPVRFKGNEAMSRMLAENWWALAIRGVSAILLGLIAIFLPGAAMLTLAMFFSAYLLVDGVFGVVSAVRAAQADQRWGLLLVEGIFDIVVGIAVFFFPAGAVLAFVIIVAFWALLSGVLRLVSAFSLTREHGRGWLIFSSVLSILFGVVLVISPLAGAVVLTWWLGAYTVVFGVFMLGFALRLRNCSLREKAPLHDARLHDA